MVASLCYGSEVYLQKCVAAAGGEGQKMLGSWCCRMGLWGWVCVQIYVGGCTGGRLEKAGAIMLWDPEYRQICMNGVRVGGLENARLIVYGNGISGQINKGWLRVESWGWKRWLF